MFKLLAKEPILDCPMREALVAIRAYLKLDNIVKANEYELTDICNEIKLLMEDAIKFNDDPTLEFIMWWNMVNPYGKYEQNN